MQKNPAVPNGYRVELLDAVSSTNTLALEALRAGEPGRLWIIARSQSQGRGRFSRSWLSEPGNLYASLMLRALPSSLSRGFLPLAVAVAVHEAVAALLPPIARSRLTIKWPNDLLYDAAKLGGILIEGRRETDGEAFVIGMGINCRHHPHDQPFPATSLSVIGYPVDPLDVFEHLARHLDARLQEWLMHGESAIRQAWLRRAYGMGTVVTVRLPQRTIEGRFETLNEEGCLLLRENDGTLQAISAGDVFFHREA